MAENYVRNLVIALVVLVFLLFAVVVCAAGSTILGLGMVGAALDDAFQEIERDLD